MSSIATELPRHNPVLPTILGALLCLAVGFLSGGAPPGEWYAQLVKPPLTPPNLAFPIAWTILYILMGVAAGLIWTRLGWRAGIIPLALFALQLALNAGWSYLFFGLHRPDWAMIEIVCLWLAILATLISFYRVWPLAGYLLVPYLLWVSFATYLNLGFWRLNL